MTGGADEQKSKKYLRGTQSINISQLFTMIAILELFSRFLKSLNVESLFSFLASEAARRALAESAAKRSLDRHIDGFWAGGSSIYSYPLGQEGSCSCKSRKCLVKEKAPAALLRNGEK